MIFFLNIRKLHVYYDVLKSLTLVNKRKSRIYIHVTMKTTHKNYIPCGYNLNIFSNK